jgi:hypothetical protein
VSSFAKHSTYAASTANACGGAVRLEGPPASTCAAGGAGVNAPCEMPSEVVLPMEAVLVRERTRTLSRAMVALFRSWRDTARTAQMGRLRPRNSS